MPATLSKAAGPAKAGPAKGKGKGGKAQPLVAAPAKAGSAKAKAKGKARAAAAEAPNQDELPDYAVSHQCKIQKAVFVLKTKWEGF